MKQVLLVDDDPRVAQNLKRLLHPLRQDWVMEFVSSGNEALCRLAETRYDILVTCVQAAEIDGIALLSYALRISPQTVRIALCGVEDQNAIAQFAALAHQYLARPCDAHTLQAAIERALTLRNILDAPLLVSLIGRLKSLPSPPSIYYRLMRAVLSDRTSTAELGSIVAEDLGMTAKVLQFANSPIFAPSRAIATPEHAVAYLGMNTVRALAIAESVFSQFGARNHPGFSPEELREHSFQVATMARRIARERRFAPQFVSDIYLGGLMHDVGKLVLGTNFPREYREVVRHFGEPEALRETERQLFGATHAEVGAYLLWLWGVPASVAGIVAQHHPDEVDASAPAAMVHLADRIVRGGKSAPDNEYLARIGLPPDLLQFPEFAAGRPGEIPASVY